MQNWKNIEEINNPIKRGFARIRYLILLIKESLDKASEWCENHIPCTPLIDFIAIAISMICQYLCENVNAFGRISIRLSKIEKSEKRFVNLKMLAITCIIVLLLALSGTEWKIFNILSEVTVFDYIDYISVFGGESDDAYFYGLLIISGISTFILNKFQKYIIGEQNSRIFSLKGFFFWLLSIYVITLVSAIIKPLQDMYAQYDFDMAPKLQGEILSMMYMLAGVIALMYALSDSVKTVLGIYMGKFCFNLYAAFRISYIVLFIFLGVNYLSGIEVFTDTYKIQSIALALFTQAVIDFLYWIGFLRLLLVLLKKTLFSFPWIVPTTWILMVLSAVLYFKS